MLPENSQKIERSWTCFLNSGHKNDPVLNLKMNRILGTLVATL